MRPFKMVKDELAAGTARPSLVAKLLSERQTRTPEEERVIMKMAASMYRAGVETTALTLTTFVVAMLLHRDVLKGAQAQIDEAIGTQRLPEFSDRPLLPYIDCIVKECLRWNTPAPLGIAHRLMCDDTYEGKLLPAGSTIMPNIWLMMHDDAAYPHPEEFRPDRYLSEPANSPARPTINPAVQDPYDAVFGFGRRICPGRHFADNSLWLTIACMIAFFDILPGQDEFGNDVLPSANFGKEFGSKPQLFPCRFIPRRRADQIQATK